MYTVYIIKYVVHINYITVLNSAEKKPTFTVTFPCSFFCSVVLDISCCLTPTPSKKKKFVTDYSSVL